ncbi:hypothetical protein AGOR_G00248170 [Albula goreensis]|uniref:Uncharacterized protein n=1 Tax=Albula goreensis TaxID=1534307 RepID=A0A8T3CBA0_9TELE|nr:hypothetical protein AGOR_G00248170 [Albula goreensis]
MGRLHSNLHKDTPRRPCLEARGRASLDRLTSISSASSKTPQEVTGVSQRRKGGRSAVSCTWGARGYHMEAGKGPSSFVFGRKSEKDVQTLLSLED